MKRTIQMVFFAFLCYGISAQNIVKGIVVDSDSQKPIEHVNVRLKPESRFIKTTLNGAFIIKDLPNGSYILEINFSGYESQKISIQLSGETIDLGLISFDKEIIGNINFPFFFKKQHG